jgi:hypothetical protein
MPRIIRVRVNTHAQSERLEEVGLDEYKAWIMAKPVDGYANEALLELLAEELNVPISTISIKSGHKSRHKLIEIE